ncbi:glycerate kinase [Candidatus Enterococcus ferrettii]|nr:glycerate kinase [Enterococcus sp. 665A]MBO1338903.1 glycerate kinase [Enterococcus sp. 665A]
MKRKIVIAMDSFKGSAKSKELGDWVKEGISRVVSSEQVSVYPIADGGEGTLDAIIAGCGGTIFTKEVAGPLDEIVAARYGMIDDQTAVIEVAEACGLHLTEQTEEDVLSATSFGVGELILAAIEKGAKTIYLGLGGSGTNDGGAGLLQALGVQLLNKEKESIQSGAIGLKDVTHISVDTIHPSLQGVKLIALSDVESPLIGQKGATAVFGPQKGARSEIAGQIDQWMDNYSQLVEKNLSLNTRNVPGAGAAGEIGFALLSFLDTKIVSGITEILKLIDFEKEVHSASLVITGEGRLDEQTLNGKAPTGIIKLAKKYDIPVIALVGARPVDLSDFYIRGIDAVFSIVSGPVSLEESIRQVKQNTVTASESMMRAVMLAIE